MVTGQNCCVRLLMRYQHELSPNQRLPNGFFSSRSPNLRNPLIFPSCSIQTPKTFRDDLE